MSGPAPLEALDRPKRAQRSHLALLLLWMIIWMGTAPPVAAQTVLRWALGAHQVDVLLAQTSVARELGFFAEGDIDVEVTPLGGGGRSIPLVASGRAEIGYVGAESLILNAVNGRDAGIVLVFNQNRDPIFNWAVPLDSPIRSPADLGGKSVGVLSLAASSTYYARGELMSLGIDPEREVEFVVAGAGPASMMLLARGEIDALVQADTILANLERTGIAFRLLPPTDYTQAYFQGGLFVRREYLRSHRRELCAFARGLSKGVVFTLANPEAAIEIHWKHFPESRPRNMSRDEAMKLSLHVLRSRMHKWDPGDELVPKHGAYSHQEWLNIVGRMGLEAKLDDRKIRALYSNELVGCANAFDPEEIQRQAQSYPRM